MKEKYLDTSINRNIHFDCLRCLGAFLVVFIHAPISGAIGSYVRAVTRIGVPIFFMLSGYFYTNTHNNRNELKQLKKILFLFLISHIIYFFWHICLCLLQNKDTVTWIKNLFSSRNIIKMLFFNESPLHYHLWYLGALLYVLIIMYVANKFHLTKLLCVLTPLFLLIDLMYGKYSILFFGHEYPYIYVRNFMFVGIPYFCLGIIIFQHRIKIISFFSEKKMFLVLSIFFFILTTFIEKYGLTYLNLNATREHYISTTLLSLTVFIYFLIPSSKTPSALKRMLASTGKNYSSDIYILHPILIQLLSYYFKKLNLTDRFLQVKPFVVFMATLSIAIIYTEIVKLVKIKKSAVT